MKLIRSIYIDEDTNFDTKLKIKNLVIRRSVLNSTETDKTPILIIDLLKEKPLEIAKKLVKFLDNKEDLEFIMEKLI
jgi:hypothetical protein